MSPDTEAESGSPFSIVALTSEAELQGVLADFARTGGAALGNVIMEDFAKNLAAELSGTASGDQTAGAISAHKVVWRAIKASVEQ